MQRLLFNIVIAVFFFTMPWWCTACLCIAGLFLVSGFYEIIIWAFLADMFYGIHGTFHGIPFFATIVAIVIYIFSLPIQKRLLRHD